MIKDRNELERFKVVGQRQGWWESRAIVIALSGGGDSMALLSMLREFFKGQIHVAHIEHGIRRGSSLADQEFVKNYCHKLGLSFYLKEGKVLDKRDKGESVEMAARRIRYDFLEEIRILTGSDWIATGHTQDDQVETILFNIMRGTGVHGLTGIREVRGCIVRPILTYTRQELRTYLVQRGIPWREDETNQDPVYTRNKIRHKLLPWIKENLNSNMDRQLLGLSSQALIDSDCTDLKSETLLRWIQVISVGGLVAWNTMLLRSLAIDVVQNLIRHQGKLLNLKTLTRARTQELALLMLNNTRWRFQWEEDIEVCGDKSLIGWIKREKLCAPNDLSIAPSCESTCHFEWGEWKGECIVRTTADYNRGDYCATLPWDGSTPILIRSFKNAAEEGYVLKDTDSIPWWDQTQWPVFILSKKSNCWYPRQYTGYYEPLKYAIIIRAKRRS